jgi:two-component system LytT family response regulator
LRAFLVDDEPLALQRLAKLLRRTGRVDVVGQATDAESAVGQIAGDAVDVVFLDIKMPGLTGFDVVARLPDGVSVVFVTAYDHHAVQAFEVSAVDYLLKPVERQRLDRTLDRLEAARRDPRGVGLHAMLQRLLQSMAPPAGFAGRLASRVGDRVQLLDVTRITHVVAEDRATYAVAAGARHILDATIAELERRLDPATFVRIHRGALVNLAWVAELHADLGGRLLVRLKDERRTELIVARDRVRTLKERLGL